MVWHVMAVRDLPAAALRGLTLPAMDLHSLAGSECADLVNGGRMIQASIDLTDSVCTPL